MSSDKCRAAALRYVSMQMKTEGQVKDYLIRKGYTREEAEDAAAFAAAEALWAHENSIRIRLKDE